MSGGPTEMMRYAHEQMRALLAQMREACAARDADAYGGAAETLLMLMQQHNMKEENILYPMCDRALGAGADAHAEHGGGGVWPLVEPMNAAEVAEFESNPFHKEAVRVRIWDDEGKKPGVKTPEFRHYVPLLKRVVARGAA